MRLGLPAGYCGSSRARTAGAVLLAQARLLDVAVDGRLVDVEALGDLGDGVVAGGVGVQDLRAQLLEALGVELAAGEAGLARPLVDAALAHAVLLGDLAHGELAVAVVLEHGLLGA